jgi:hypothetical protein
VLYLCYPLNEYVSFSCGLSRSSSLGLCAMMSASIGVHPASILAMCGETRALVPIMFLVAFACTLLGSWYASCPCGVVIWCSVRLVAIVEWIVDFAIPSTASVLIVLPWYRCRALSLFSAAFPFVSLWPSVVCLLRCCG